MRLNGVHFVQVEGEKPFGGNGFQRGVIDLEVDGLRFNEHLFGWGRETQFRPSLGLTIASGGHQGPFDEVVVECPGKPRFIAVVRKAVENIGQVGGDFGFGVRWKQRQETVGGGFPWVVGHAGLEADRDDGVRCIGEHTGGEENGVRGALFDDGVGEQVVDTICDGVGRGLTLNEVAADRPDMGNVHVVVGLELSAHDIASNVSHTFPLTGRDLNTSDWHVLHRARWAGGGCSMRSL